MSAEAGQSSLPLTLQRLVLSRRGGRRIDAATGELAEEARRRRTARMAARDRWTSVGLAGAITAVAVALAILLPSDRSPSPLIAILLVGLLAGASRIEFEVGAGSAVPTQ